MRTLGNILWFLLAGWWLALAYVLAGLVAVVLIVTIPFGIAAFRIAAFALWPFGKTIVRRDGAGTLTMVGNVVWFVVAGLWLAIGHLLSGIALCVTIIGIPLGLANFKLIPVSLMPLGVDIVSTDDPRAFGLA
jgi:uncharacterized membrane protein YccF (DUF307 family)